VDAHPLQPFLDRLHARIGALGIAVAAWRLVDDREEPVARYEDGVVELASLNLHVLGAAAACGSASPWADAALDLLAAHVITVLNIALTHITDATEAYAIARLVGD
nr:hypothetical protein [Myxococcota bacterium]